MNNFYKTTEKLISIIKDRRRRLPEKSYTTELFRKGQSEIIKKVGEEAIEVVVAGMKKNNKEVIYEIGDLWYHLLVFLILNDISLEDISKELDSRYK